MQVFTIHEMRWANTEQTSVYLVADTSTGNGELIGTPYNAESIIWDAVRAFPVENIQPMVEVAPEQSDVTDVDFRE